MIGRHRQGPLSALALVAALTSATLTAVALATALGCRPAPPGSTSAFHVIDDAGDTVAVARPVRRVVSLIPATTELLFAFGAGPRLVGRTSWCDFPAEALRVPSLGDGINPNLEAVIAARPDLVLLYLSAQNTDIARRLRGFGIPAVQVRTDHLSDVPRLARLLGPVVGRREAAESLATAFTSELKASAAGRSGDPPTVFLLAWEQPPMTVGRGSFLTEVIERAGGRNLFSDVAASSAPISVEAVVARNPDVVLVLDRQSPGIATRPEWQGVRAVRQRRFVYATGSEFSRPSPRAPQAIRELAAQLAAQLARAPRRPPR